MIRVAGGIVLHPTHGVALVSQKGTSWSLPKGHVEEGEDVLTGARREIHEETGIPESALFNRGEIITYERNRIKLKESDAPELRRITLFFFTTTWDTLSPLDPDNPEARWVKTDEVSSLLTHPKDKEVFESIKHKIYI